MRIKDLPGNERPRERLVLHGAESLRNAELIAILLRTGLKGVSAIHVAEDALAAVRDARTIGSGVPGRTAADQGRGPRQGHRAQSAFILAQRMAREIQTETPCSIRLNESLISCEDNRFYEVEHFQVLLLNTRKRLIRTEQISQGTLDTILVHPREVFKLAIAQRFGSRPGP